MRYKGKACEIVGKKEVFGQRIAWIRLMEDGSFHEVLYDELEKPSTELSLPYIRFVSIAAKIKDEVARKNILAPYESSLIPLPHQILVLEKVMQSNQNRFMLDDEVGMGKTIETGLILCPVRCYHLKFSSHLTRFTTQNQMHLPKQGR